MAFFKHTIRTARRVAVVAFTIGGLAASPALAQSGEKAIYQRFNDSYDRGDYTQALVEAEKLEAAARARLGTKHPGYGAVLTYLGMTYNQLGKYDKAEEVYKRVLPIYEKALGANHAGVGEILNNLGAICEAQGKYGEAEQFYKRALPIYEKTVGPNNTDYANTLSNLARIYERTDRFDDAVSLYQRALGIKEKFLGSNNRELVSVLANLASTYRRMGKYAAAEELQRRAIAINEHALGPDHPDMSSSLHDLAATFEIQDKLADAEGLDRRALEIRERSLGQNHPAVALSLSGLAVLCAKQGKQAEAAELYKRALAIQQAAFSKGHPDMAGTLNNIGLLYTAQGKYSDAQESFGRALEIWERTVGANSLKVATSLNNLALVYHVQGKYPEAEVLYKRSLGVKELTLGSSHPDVAQSLNTLSLLDDARGNVDGALAWSRKVKDAVLAHTALEERSAGPQQKVGLIEQRASYFQTHVLNLRNAARLHPEQRLTFGMEAFESAQWSMHSSAAAAVQQMSARFSLGDDNLARLVRESQDLSDAWRLKDRSLTAERSKPANEQSRLQAEELRKQIGGIQDRLNAKKLRLEREFPAYATLVRPIPLKVDEIQKLLGPDEALVAFLVANKESYAFAITRESFDWTAIAMDRGSLESRIREFRHGLTVDGSDRGLARAECSRDDAASRGLSRFACANPANDQCTSAQQGSASQECDASPIEASSAFDLARSRALYQDLFGPIEPIVKDKRNLLISPSGPLTALPFHLLVTEQPVTSATPGQPSAGDAYREAAWLLKRHAISVLPSAASLRALRVHARASRGTKSMIGFGDPVFDASRESSSATAPSTQAAMTRSYSDFWRGTSIDRAELALALPRLPETAYELKTIADGLRAPSADIFLRADATETAVKRAQLADYRLLYFATHGLVAGDVKGLGEPSLALSIPSLPTDLDDGLLTASEIAQLKLNADWVVLSACNTIAGDKPGAEALSGLARAFFYSGARALLVSHWAVESRAATRLTTSIFKIMEAEPTVGRAEALRRAMLDFMTDKSSPRNARPALWGPFVLVGEGTVL